MLRRQVACDRRASASLVAHDRFPRQRAHDGIDRTCVEAQFPKPLLDQAALLLSELCVLYHRNRWRVPQPFGLGCRNLCLSFDALGFLLRLLGIRLSPFDIGLGLLGVGLRFQDLGLCPFRPELFIASSAFSLFTRTTLRFELALDLVRLRDSGCRLWRDRGNRWRYGCGSGLREADLSTRPNTAPRLPFAATLTAFVERRARLLEQLGNASAACSPAASMRETGMRAELENIVTVFFGTSLVN